jgi:hypothetical protein
MTKLSIIVKNFYEIWRHGNYVAFRREYTHANGRKSGYTWMEQTQGLDGVE